MDLKIILQSLVPDNIRQIPLVSSSIEAFAEMLEKNSAVACRIRRIFDVDNSVWYKRDENGNIVQIPDSDYPYIEQAKRNLKQGLFYTYLSVLFSRMEVICQNPDVIKIVGLRNISKSPLFKSPYDIANSEYLGSFRYFQQCSGTVPAIRYIYQFSRYLESGVLDDSLELETGDPFFLDYKGELHKSVFLDFNKPLSHPCGWCFQYSTVAKKVFQDYYGIKFKYNIKTIIVGKGRKKIIFGKKPSDVRVYEIVRERAIYNIPELLKTHDVIWVISDNTPHNTGQTLNPVALKITDLETSENETIITFDTGNVLYMITGITVSVRFGTLSDIETSYFEFPENYVILPFDTTPSDYTFQYKDSMTVEFTIEPGKMQDTYYFEDNYENSFRLKGNEYPFCPGIDESRHRVTNNANIMPKFTCSVEYRSQNITYLRLQDDFGHFTAVVRDQTLSSASQNTFKVRTHGFYGEWLTFRAYDGISYNYDHYVRMNTLNRPSCSVTLSEFSLENFKLHFKARSSLSSLSTTVTIGSDTFTRQTGPMQTFEQDTSSYPRYAGFRIEITDFNDTVIIEGNGLNSANYNFFFDLPKYPADAVIKPVFVNCTPDTMDDQAPGKTLGQLNGTPKLKWKNDTVNDDVYVSQPDGDVSVYDLNPRNHSGVCYINRGYSKVQSESSDCAVMDCTKYVEDDFYCETSGYDTWLKFDNPEADGSEGKYIVCRYNSDPQTDVVRGMLHGYILTFKGIE